MLRFFEYFVSIMLLINCFFSQAEAATPSEQNLKAATPPVILDFGESKLPENIHVEQGNISLCDRHFIIRGQSLRWDFLRNGKLLFNMPIPYFTERDGLKVRQIPAYAGFTVWIYLEKELPNSQLRFSFGNQKRSKPDVWFDCQLNFTGWRGIVVGFDRHMKGKAAFDMDQLTILAPADIPAGTLWLDAMIPVEAVDYRIASPLPHQSESAATILAGKKLPELTQEDLAGFRSLEEKIKRELSVRDFTPMKELEQEFQTFGLRWKGGFIQGKFLAFNLQLSLFLPPGYPVSESIEFRRFGVFAQRIALRYYTPETTQEERKSLENMYVMMIRHLLDQGFADGSVRGTYWLLGYFSRELFSSLSLMRKTLIENDLLEPITQMVLWYNDLQFLTDPAKWPRPDFDVFNTQTFTSLCALSLMPDSPKKAALLRGFQGYYGRNMSLLTPGTENGFKPDGTIFHHWGHYPAYGFPGLAGAALAYDLLSDTPWKLPNEARERLIFALKAAFIYTHPYSLGSDPAVAIGLTGRHPFGPPRLGILAMAYRRMASDPGMAAIYRRLRPNDHTFPSGPAMTLDSGHWSFNYGGFGIHRFGGKMVTLKGFNEFVWGAEIYTKDNRYGRYQSYGTVSILPQGDFREEGWDWNRNPGVTSRHLPLEILESPRITTLMLRNDSTISGSSNLEGKYGMSGLELSEPKMKNFDPEFRAVKSVFAFGPRLVALGCNISAGTDYPVETTLMQIPVVAGGKPIWLNDLKGIDALPAEKQTHLPAWTADSYGNAWFVFSGGTLKLERKKQQSRHDSTRRATTGDFETVYIDHGIRPKKADYEYLLHLDMTPEKAAAYMQKLQSPADRPYIVLSRSPECHAVFDKASGVTGAIFFKPYKLANTEISVNAVTPGYLMFRRDQEELVVSLNSPVPSIDGKKARQARVRLRGRWQAVEPCKEAKISIIGAETEISASFLHGIPVQLRLRQL